MKFRLRATIVCSHVNLEGDHVGWGCNEADYYEADPEAVTLEQFGREAKQRFISRGWQCDQHGELCPSHTTTADL